MSESGGGTHREIRERYKATLRARQEYRRSVGTEFETAAHEALHETVFDLFDALRPLLKTANATDDLWEEEPLWPVEREYVPAAICPECEHIEHVEFADEERLCPECGAGRMEQGEAPAVDEHGEPVYRWQRGLQCLDGFRNRTRTVDVSYEDALGEYGGQRTEKILLEPDRLITISDLLDEAMNKLDLLVTIDDDLPKGQLSSVEQ